MVNLDLAEKRLKESIIEELTILNPSLAQAPLSNSPLSDLPKNATSWLQSNLTESTQQAQTNQLLTTAKSLIETRRSALPTIKARYQTQLTSHQNAFSSYFQLTPDPEGQVTSSPITVAQFRKVTGQIPAGLVADEAALKRDHLRRLIAETARLRALYLARIPDPRLAPLPTYTGGSRIPFEQETARITQINQQIQDRHSAALTAAEARAEADAKTNIGPPPNAPDPDSTLVVKPAAATDAQWDSYRTEARAALPPGWTVELVTPAAATHCELIITPS